MQTLFGQDKQTQPDTAESFSYFYRSVFWETWMIVFREVPGPLDEVPRLKEEELLIDTTYLMLGKDYIGAASIKRVRYIKDAFNGLRFLPKAALYGAYYGIKFGSMIWLAGLLIFFFRQVTLPPNMFTKLLVSFIGGAVLCVLWNVVRASPSLKPWRFGVVVLEFDKGGSRSFAIRMQDARRILPAFERLGCAAQAQTRGNADTERELAQWLL